MPATGIEELKPVYLIQGEDEYLLSSALRRLRSIFEAADPAGMDIDVFDAGQATADEIVSAANTLPFVSSKRLVVAQSIDKMPASNHGPLVEYVERPNPSTCLVLVAARLARNTRLFKALDSAGAVAEYTSPKKSELASWVTKLVAQKGKRIARDAAETLVKATGGELRMLASESDKLIAYVGDRETIELADVEALVEQAAPPVYAFLDALASRDALNAVRLLRRILASGEHPLGLLAAASGRVRRLISAKALSDRGARSAEIARETGVPEWQARNLVADAQCFMHEELIEALQSAAEAEERMKTSRGDAGLVLERWVLGVCARDRAVRTIRGQRISPRGS